MLALAKGLLLIARYFRRMAVSLEKIQALYELELRTRDIWIPTKGQDVCEVSYGIKTTSADDPGDYMDLPSRLPGELPQDR